MTPTREQLASIEWAVEDRNDERAFCPACMEHIHKGHTPDCWLAACLAAPPPEPQAMPPIKPGDWVRVRDSKAVWQVREVGPDGTVALHGYGWIDPAEFEEIRKANGTVWTRDRA